MLNIAQEGSVELDAGIVCRMIASSGLPAVLFLAGDCSTANYSA